MGQNNHGSSDLDMFEGLGKAAPDADANANANANANATGERAKPKANDEPPRVEPKRTLLGVPDARSVGSGDAATHAPPPPPGRDSLPDIDLSGDGDTPTRSSETLSMDWTDDEEATRVLDKESRRKKLGDRPRPTHEVDLADVSDVDDSPEEEPPHGNVADPFDALGRAGESRNKNAAIPLPPQATQWDGAEQLTLSPPGQKTFPLQMPGLRLPSPQDSAGRLAVPTQHAAETSLAQATLARGAQKYVLLGLAALVVLVLGIGAYWFMNRPATLIVNVADARGGAVRTLQVLVDGAPRCEQAPCIVTNINGGHHEIRIVAPGFETPAPRAISVDSRQELTVDYSLVPSKVGGTGFRIGGRQTNAKLFVDGREIGPLPQDVRDLTPGEHQVRIAGDRYAPFERTISVAKDQVQDLGTLPLTVIRGKVTLELGTPGARVYLSNGSVRKEVPQFPIAIDFDPKEAWVLQARKEGFDDFEQVLSFDDGVAEKSYTVTLTPKGTAPAQASPANGPSQPGAAAAPGQGGSAAVQGAPASRGMPTPGAESPKPPPQGEGHLNINSFPSSTVILDGKPIGSTPKLNVAVAAGTHTITFVNVEESLKKTITVTLAAGETKPAVAKLKE